MPPPSRPGARVLPDSLGSPGAVKVKWIATLPESVPHYTYHREARKKAASSSGCWQTNLTNRLPES